MSRTSIAAVLCLAAAVLAGCASDAGAPEVGEDETTPRATATIAPPPTLDPAATPNEAIEVHGVVGAVNVQSRIIEIRPTGEVTQFTRIALTPNTTVKRAGGGVLNLDGVRPSDRIIAFGRPGDDPTTLLSSDVTVQQVVPGSQPGGG
jgi:hypothetical protein